MSATARRLAAAFLVPGLLLSWPLPGPAFELSCFASGSRQHAPTAWQLGPVSPGASAVFAHLEAASSQLRVPGSAPSPTKSAGEGHAKGAAKKNHDASPHQATLSRAGPSATQPSAVDAWARLFRARTGLLSAAHTAPPVEPVSLPG